MTGNWQGVVQVLQQCAAHSTNKNLGFWLSSNYQSIACKGSTSLTVVTLTGQKCRDAFSSAVHPPRLCELFSMSSIQYTAALNRTPGRDYSSVLAFALLDPHR